MTIRRPLKSRYRARFFSKPQHTQLQQIAPHRSVSGITGTVQIISEDQGRGFAKGCRGLEGGCDDRPPPRPLLPPPPRRSWRPKSFSPRSAVPFFQDVYWDDSIRLLPPLLSIFLQGPESETLLTAYRALAPVVEVFNAESQVVPCAHKNETTPRKWFFFLFTIFFVCKSN